MSSRYEKVAWLGVVAAVSGGCHKKSEAPSTPVSSSAPSAPPLDRLLPGELAQGSGQVFGFHVPRTMFIRGAFLDIAYIAGASSPEAVANYVRDRVDAEHVEIGAASTLFPHVHIKGGAPDRSYDFEVSPLNDRETQLIIRDVTPRPANPPGMTDAERWRQAGYAPDGKPLDSTQLK